MRTKSNEKRLQIIRVATDIFLERGFSSASMSGIAAAVGGSKTTLYSHFDSKEELFLEVMKSLASGRVEMAFASLRLNGDISTTLRKFGEYYLEVTCSEDILKIFRIGISESGNSSAGKLLYEHGPKLCRTRISEFFSEQIKKNIIKECSPWLAAIHYLRLIESDLSELYLLGSRPQPSRTEIIDSVNSGVDIFLSAYRYIGKGRVQEATCPAPRTGRRLLGVESGMSSGKERS